MFLLFGLGRGRRGRTFLVVRVVLLVAFLIVVFAFHPHGTTLDILQAVRVAIVVAFIAAAWLARRRTPNPGGGSSD
jgi:peptidoglycan/LPS O-acetylase OafA/YrhL